MMRSGEDDAGVRAHAMFGSGVRDGDDAGVHACERARACGHVTCSSCTGMSRDRHVTAARDLQQLHGDVVDELLQVWFAEEQQVRVPEHHVPAILGTARASTTRTR